VSGGDWRTIERPRLRAVFEALEREAAAPATAATLAGLLRAPITIDDIASFIRFDAANYVRSLVARGPRWEMRLLCWRPGQTTSVHGHGGAACAFRILRGSAVESILGQRDRVWAPGDVIQEGGVELVHQVGNGGDDALLTLHVYSPALPVDEPSPRHGREVVIVGGGLSGVAAAYHLLRRGGPDLRLTMIERGPWIGRGLAYGVDSEVFRLNVPASKMSLDPEAPGDFVAWAGAEAAPEAFLPRARYGAYVVARLADAIRKSRAKLRVVRGHVSGADATGVQLGDGTRLAAEVVVLATGLAPRLAPSAFPDDARIIDAWDECAIAALPRTGRLLILGAGLTALDVVALLESQAFAGAVTIASRRGLLPRPHLSPLGAAPALAAEVVASAPRRLRALLCWGRSLVRDYERRGLPWQHAIDALRPHVGGLWRELPPADRRRFARSVRPFWEVMRHRAPADAHALVERWRSDGRLELIAAGVASCRPSARGLEVVLRLPGGATRVEIYDRIVRCIGPALERAETDSPLLHDLIATGHAAADPAGLGIVTDAEGRVVDARGHGSDRLFALGALRRASSWETTAVPEISRQALALARRLTHT
jgi:uncharacterized NAD(P)/FAD-binding protein YdhS